MFFHRILYPIIRQFPFFCCYCALMGNIVIRRLHGKYASPLQYPDISYWDIISSTTVVFLVAYLFSSFLSLSKKKWMLIIAYSIVFTLSSVDFFLIEKFRMFISPNLLMLLAETNQKESHEFITTFMGIKDNLVVYSTICSIIILTCLFEHFYYLKVFPLFKRLAAKRMWLSKAISAAVVLTLALGLYGSGTYIRMLNCESTDDLSRWDTSDKTNPHDPLTNSFYAFYGVRLANNEMKQAIVSTSQMDVSSSCIDDSLTVLFVIGESYIKKHAQIYGYNLQTTPYMQREKDCGNLFVLHDVCSPFNLTSYAMKSLLCCNSISEGEEWFRSPFFPTVFRHAGFNVFFWDNQKDDTVASWSFALNNFLYNDYLKSFYKMANERSFQYDGELIDDYQNAVKSNGKRDFIIFHLMGQHSDADSRYPHTKDFSIFTADSIIRESSYLTPKKKERIAQYDNATYYNDFVISKIIEPLKDKNATVLYLSDHGEEMYDYRDLEGRRGDNSVNKNLLEYQYGVPFVIWCSPKYQALHPEVIENIRNAVDKPFMTDNVCQVLFHLGGINTSYYIPERDPLNKLYRKPKRLVNKTIDYDAYLP